MARSLGLSVGRLAWRLAVGRVRRRRDASTPSATSAPATSPRPARIAPRSRTHRQLRGKVRVPGAVGKCTTARIGAGEERRIARAAAAPFEPLDRDIGGARRAAGPRRARRSRRTRVRPDRPRATRPSPRWPATPTRRTRRGARPRTPTGHDLAARTDCHDLWTPARRCGPSGHPDRCRAATMSTSSARCVGVEVTNGVAAVDGLPVVDRDRHHEVLARFVAEAGRSSPVRRTRRSIGVSCRRCSRP